MSFILSDIGENRAFARRQAAEEAANTAANKAKEAYDNKKEEWRTLGSVEAKEVAAVELQKLGNELDEALGVLRGIENSSLLEWADHNDYERSAREEA